MLKWSNAAVLVVSAFGMWLSTEAHAQPVLQRRCSLDSLSIEDARARLEWTRTCGLLRNVHDVSKRYVTNPEDVANGYPALYDYQEYQTAYSRNVYAGSAYDFNVNESYISSYYAGSSSIIQAYESSGFTPGYYKWSKNASRMRPQPLYPTFGSTSDLYEAANQPLYVRRVAAGQPPDCNLYTQVDGNGNGTGPVATDFYVNAYCVASCYTPEQNLLFSDGEQSILSALQSRRSDIVTLSSQSTLEQPLLQVNPLHSYVAELRDAPHVVHDIRTASGGLLRVTPTHGVLTSDGRMVQASSLQPGQELLKADGSPDPIVSVSLSNHFGKVYNVNPATQSLLTHVVVAQGFLVGSSQYQNDFVQYVNRIILHKNVPEDVIPE